MYPTTLNMTRDECRGILRRLELETYSSVISTFRAQGGLSEVKLKLLDDLRGIFHISPDRHRAEARRVANDERLGTIAEAISGPNTYQEWCREGRRSFPLLPRSAPLTAFSNVANAVLERTTDENSKMPYPSETFNMRPVENYKFEDANRVVQEDPALTAADERRNLKRSSLSLADHIAANVPVSKRKATIVEGQLNSQPHVHTNTKIQQLYHNHSKTQSRHKKMFSKRNLSVNTKKSNSPSGKTLQSRVIKPPDFQTLDNKTLVGNPRILHTYASVPQHKVIVGNFISDVDPYGINKLPQIATSKKDITKNLSKLNLSQMPQSLHTQKRYAKENDLKPEMSGVHLQQFPVEEHSFTGSPYSADIPISGKKGLMLQTGRCNIKQGSSIGTKYHIKSKILENQVAESSSTINVSSEESMTNQNMKHNSLPLQPNAQIFKSEDEHHYVQLITPSEPKMSPNSDLVSTVETKKISTDSAVMIDNGQQVQNSTNINMQPNANKPKIQITSQQILSPIISNIKFPLGMQLKGVPNRKAVKILTSSGKMFFQSFDGSKIGKLNSVTPQKNINPSSVMRTQLISSARPLTVQKVQLVPSSGSRQVTVNKPNMLLMSTSVTPTSGSGTLIKGVPIAKSKKGHDFDKSLDDVQNSSVSKVQNNVVVIGTVPIGKSAIKNENMFSNNSCIITEDTPVDILTSPVGNTENSASNEENCFEIKRSMINQNECIIKNTSNKDSYMAMTSNPTIESSNSSVEKIKTTETTHNEVIGTTTDWEMELDQQVNKMRNSCKRLILTNKLENEQEYEDLNSDDNFHEVIEEETVGDDEEVLCEGGDLEERIEFDVSCGSATDEVDENVAIEYVEDTTANSFEEGEEVYVHKEEDIYLTRNSRNRREGDVDASENFNNNADNIQCKPSGSVSNGKLNAKKHLDSPSFMYEIRQFDDNAIRQGIYVNKANEDYDSGSTAISGSKRGISN